MRRDLIGSLAAIAVIYGIAITAVAYIAPKTKVKPVATAQSTKANQKPMSDADFAKFEKWQRDKALPALGLTIGDPVTATPNGSRLGGPAWLADGETWPMGSDRKPLVFLAQIDFATMPRLPDYPERGVLQFFIGRDDLYGAEFDRPLSGDFRVIWRESIQGPGRMHEQRPLAQGKQEDYSPLSAQVLKQGRALNAKRSSQKPSSTSWFFERDLPGLLEQDGMDRIYDLESEQMETRGFYSHIGGHPEFTQSDFRTADALGDYNRVLLQLWSDDTQVIMWGDSGQGNFMISRNDLLKRDFTNVSYQWDAY